MRTSFRNATLVTILHLVAITAHSKTASQIYELASKSTVVVENFDEAGKAKSFGSGVVFADGNVATNCHVVKGASSLKVRIGTKRLSATLRYSDWDRDVCSLSVAGLDAPAIVIGNSKSLKVGAKVYAIGAPKGLELTLSDGIISSLRVVDGSQYIQTTAAISRGSSGGGLFDENGALVGLTTFYLAEGQNLNFAVPVEWVKELTQRSTKASVASGVQPITQWLNKAIELETRKDWPAAIEHSHRWTKAQPGSSSAWFRLGIAYDNVGQTAKAIEAFQQALRIKPGDTDGWNILGIAYGKTGQSVKAIEALQRALSLQPRDAAAWNNLGIAYDKAGQSAKAIEAFQQALRIMPEYADAWLVLGITYGKAGQTANAIEAYEQALRIKPENATAWFLLGVAYGKASQTAKAIEAYEQALRIEPENASAWNNLGVIYSDAGQSAKAVDAYQQALRIKSDSASAWYNLGVTYGNSGQRGKVLEVYKRLKSLDPVKADVFFNKFVMP